jgi:hypothetical protein
MKLKAVILASALAFGASSVYAGQFVSLTNGNGTSLSSANGGLKNGSNNPNRDIFYIENLSTTTYLAGYGYGSDNGTIATSLDYKSFQPVAGTPTIATSTLTLLDYHITENVPLLNGIAQGTIFDFVYRDSTDGTLVFGTRYMNVVDNDQEVNYLFRQGAGDNPAAAWTFLSDYDLRMYQAAQTSNYTYDSSVPYEDGVVRQKADISVSEGNPWSALYLVKTDATDYTWGANAIGFYQAGEEGQAVVGGYISGFIASVTPVPEADTYGLMLAGLGVAGAAARRRKAK